MGIKYVSVRLRYFNRRRYLSKLSACYIYYLSTYFQCISKQSFVFNNNNNTVHMCLMSQHSGSETVVVAGKLNLCSIVEALTTSGRHFKLYIPSSLFPVCYARTTWTLLCSAHSKMGSAQESLNQKFKN